MKDVDKNYLVILDWTLGRNYISKDNKRRIYAQLSLDEKKQLFLMGTIKFSKTKEYLSLFNNEFDLDKEFLKEKRNFFHPYPIEVYELIIKNVDAPREFLKKLELLYTKHDLIHNKKAIAALLDKKEVEKLRLSTNLLSNKSHKVSKLCGNQAGIVKI